jgi:hypothetical protein
MVRRIRQAYAVLSTTPNAIEFDVSLSGVDYHVYYESSSVSPRRSCGILRSALWRRRTIT